MHFGLISQTSQLCGADALQLFSSNTRDPLQDQLPSHCDPPNASDLTSLLDKCSIRTGCEHIGLVIGSNNRLSDWGSVGTLIKSAPSLREALSDIVRNERLLAISGAAYLRDDRDEIAIGFTPLCSSPAQARQLCLTTISAWNALIVEATGQRPCRVMFAGLPVHIQQEVKMTFSGSTIHFGSCQHELRYTATQAKRPLAGYDLSTRVTLLRRVSASWKRCSQDYKDSIRRIVANNIMLDRAQMRKVSETLCIHPRTINRRLCERHTNFRDIVNGVRFELAQYLLMSTSLRTSDVAERLGYSEPSVFARAFRHWSGYPPNEWRHKHNDLFVTMLKTKAPQQATKQLARQPRRVFEK